MVIAMLYTSIDIGIARDQYYWVLDIGCLSWYRSNPNYSYYCSPLHSSSSEVLSPAKIRPLIEIGAS